MPVAAPVTEPNVEANGMPDEPLQADAFRVDLDTALQRLGGDAELLRDLADFYVRDAGGLLAEAAAGLDAGDLERAERAAHSLKGLSANFSETCAGAAQRVEQAARSGETGAARRLLEPLSRHVEQLIDVLRREVLC